MAQFDDAFEAPLPNAIPGDRMAFMENQLHYLYLEVTNLRGVTNQAPTPPPQSLSPLQIFWHPLRPSYVQATPLSISDMQL